MSHKPLKATDKRRSGNRGLNKDEDVEKHETGEGKVLTNLFNDRRRPNGHGHRAK